MQKIAIIKYLLQQKGGIEKRFQNYLEEFAKRGFKVSVFYASEKTNYDRIDGVDYRKVPLGLVPSRSLRKIFFARKISKLLSGGEYDEYLKLSMGRTGAADIVIAAGNYPEAQADDVRASNWFQHPMYYLDKQSFKTSHLIIAASHLVKQEIEKLFLVEKEKVKVLHPPVKSRDFFVMPANEIEEAAEKHRLDPSKTNFLFVSTGHKRKGLQFLLGLFEQLDSTKYELFVAGDAFETDLDHVKSLGFQNQTTELYNMVDCLLHPASYEAFGQVITESLLCGTPVLVSDRVGAKEIINNGTGQVLPFDDAESWLSAIKKVQKKNDRVAANTVGKELDIAIHIDKMLANWENYNS